MFSGIAEGASDYPALKNENGPRCLLSRTGGRLPALQAVSKPDAKAEREHNLYSSQHANCQDLEPQPTQNGGSDIGQLLWRNDPRNELTFTAGASPTIFEAIKARPGNRHRHIAFRPHLLRRKRAWQRLQKCKLNMIGHLWARRCCAQRNNRYQIASSRQSWDDDNNRTALDHFWYDETAKVTQQYFAQFRIIHQRHLSARNGSLKNLEGLS
jgi:hypothetical protein